MLIDSHCHLDFADFAAERDAVVERARAAGRQADDHHLDRIGSIWPDRCSSPRPMKTFFARSGRIRITRMKKPKLRLDRLVALARHPKCVGIGEAGLDYHYDRTPRDIAARVFRTHIGGRPAKRAANRHSCPRRGRRYRRDPARRNGEGRLSRAFSIASPHRPIWRRLPLSTWAIYFLFGCRDVQEFAECCGKSPAPCQWTGCWSRPTRRFWLPFPIAANATNRPSSRQPRELWLRSRASRSRPSPARRAPIRCGCSAKCLLPPRTRRPREPCLHHSRLRLLGRGAADRPRLGRLRSQQPEKPPPALLAAGRATGESGPKTQVLVDMSPDLREQLLGPGIGRLDAILLTHAHADHIHGIDDIRPLVIMARRKIDLYMDAADCRHRATEFRLYFRNAARQPISCLTE